MLARLISAEQVVLLYTTSEVLLFYQEMVYMREWPSFSCVPMHQLDPLFYAWALVDADSTAQGPPINSDHAIWPIQASSPQPIRWKAWSKQRSAVVLGMPLWNMEELKQGYVLVV